MFFVWTHLEVKIFIWKKKMHSLSKTRVTKLSNVTKKQKTKQNDMIDRFDKISKNFQNFENCSIYEVAMLSSLKVRFTLLWSQVQVQVHANLSNCWFKLSPSLHPNRLYISFKLNFEISTLEASFLPKCNVCLISAFHFAPK